MEILDFLWYIIYPVMAMQFSISLGVIMFMTLSGCILVPYWAINILTQEVSIKHKTSKLSNKTLSFTMMAQSVWLAW